MPCLANLGTCHTWDFGFSSKFDCRVFVHARIYTLMRHRFWSLLPSSVFDWVVIIVSVRYTLTPLDTPLHPVSITLTTLCVVCTGLSSFRLVPVSTFPAVTSLHLRKHITARVTHHPPTWHTSHLYYSLTFETFSRFYQVV